MLLAICFSLLRCILGALYIIGKPLWDIVHIAYRIIIGFVGFILSVIAFFAFILWLITL